MNTEIKGIVRYGEEQLGDGIVRPSADITAQMIVTHVPSSEASQRRRSVCRQEVHRSVLRLHLSRNTMLPLKWVTIVPAHDGPLLLEFFGNGKLKSKKGNEMCWYRQPLSVCTTYSSSSPGAGGLETRSTWYVTGDATRNTGEETWESPRSTLPQLSKRTASETSVSTAASTARGSTTPGCGRRTASTF